jgi:hypothetical protein
MVTRRGCRRCFRRTSAVARRISAIEATFAQLAFWGVDGARFRTERLKAFRPRPAAGAFSWRLFARANESATKTIFPRPLFARVRGRVLILGPAIRRGAFFMAIVRPAL